MARKVVIPVVAIALAAGLVACGEDPPERPNVLLVSIDSLRPDHLGLYGYERETSPNLERLAADSVVFEEAYSTSSWTLPAHVSMLTGLYSEAHGVQHVGRRATEKTELLSERLARLGYTTAAVVSGPFVSRQFGFAQGWDVYDDETMRFEDPSASHLGVTSPRLHDRVVELLDEIESGPFFLFVHYWDVHYDYNPPEPWSRRFDADYSGELEAEGFYRNDAINPRMDERDLAWVRALYDGEIAFTDHHLGKLLDELERRQLYDGMLIAVVADHGDEFFEHGAKGHRANLYDTTLRVPMLLKFPHGQRAGTRSSCPTSVVDLAPTIFQVVGVEATSSHGRSLVDPCADRDRPLFADLHGLQKAVIRDGWKLILTHQSVGRAPELYDLDADAGERLDRFAAEPERAAAMAKELERFLAGAAAIQQELGRETATPDDETRNALEALGYVD